MTEVINKRKEHLLSSPTYKIDSKSYINSWLKRLNPTPLQSRILKGYEDLCENPIANVFAAPRHSSNLRSWNLLFIGEKDTVFEDGVFEANMVLPFNYPNGLPLVTFTSDVFHPNINAAGLLSIAFLEALIEEQNSKQIYDMKTVLLAIRTCLDFPDKKVNKHCLLSNNTAALVFENSLDEYMEQAKLWMNKHREFNSTFKAPQRSAFHNMWATKPNSEIRPMTFLKLEEPTSKRERLSTFPNVSKRSEVEKYIHKRLLKDWEILCSDAPKGITGSLSDENFCIWHVTLPSPIGTPLKATLLFNEKYPYEPPEMKFTTKIFHPNVDKSGKVCLGDSDWTPAHTVWSLLAAVQCLIAEPNIDSYVNASARDMFLNNPAMYHTIALEHFEREVTNSKNNESTGESEGTIEEQVFTHMQIENTFVPNA